MEYCDIGHCVFGRQAIGGSGPTPPPSGILLVGEAPGKDELRLGRPFIGRAGQLLDRLLYSADISRAELRITNTCACVDLDREVRKPLPAELDACRPRLDWEVTQSEARVLLLMGNTALSAFMPGFRIGQVYNRARFDGRHILFPTYHPAAALRSPHLEDVIFDGLKRVKILAREGFTGDEVTL